MWNKAASDRHAVVVAEIEAAQARGETPPAELVAERQAIAATRATTLAGLSRAELQQKRAELQALEARLRGPQAGTLATGKLTMVRLELEAITATGQVGAGGAGVRTGR